MTSIIKMLSTFLWVLSVTAASYFSGIEGSGTCKSPQTLEFGRFGTISCSFNEDFIGVLWYNTSDFTNNDPILDYQNSIKKGKGYTSGEYDINSDGSLIINNVSLAHEHIFKVAYFYSQKEPIIVEVEINIIVKPLVPFPLFDLCGNSTNVCYASVDIPYLQCTVGVGRPFIPLHIVKRTTAGEENITVSLDIISQGVGYTSRVITKDAFHGSPHLMLLICRASSLPGLLEHNESFMVAQKGDVNVIPSETTITYIPKNSRMELICPLNGGGFAVWKKTVSATDSTQELLLYFVNIGINITKIVADDVTSGGRNSLVVSNTQVKHEGYYICAFGDGVKDDAKVYKIVVVVNPVPRYPVIDGCNQKHYCALEAEHTGTLTCTVTGIRPEILLEWRTFHNNDAGAISFDSDVVTVKDNGETLDITLTSSFRMQDKLRDKLTIECRVVSSISWQFNLTTKIDLLLVRGHYSTYTAESIDQSTGGIEIVWIFLVAVVLICSFCIVSGVIIKRRKWKQRKWKTKEAQEMKSLFNENGLDENRFSGLKEQFLEQIKDKYKDLYDAVKPIPYIKDRLYCVDRVFVEGGIEFLSAPEVGAKEAWNSLKSYTDIFNDSRVQSKRRILEGEPGYGKSTVTLQFAYDWCNSVSTSPLRDVEILILLRLRQLGGVPCIYKAIKRFLLPSGSQVTESDVKNILAKCKSVVVILDGFDEYPDKDDEQSDVIRIIAKELFFEYEVLLTTRSSFLPNNFPASTKRVRLTGFHDNARKYYIRKAVIGNDDDGARKIEGYLEDNPILSDLCQVPLLFVIFAHMTHESENFRKLNSVTSFFRYMISSFHSHMRNKMGEDNVLKYKLFETDHQSLDKLAFEAFSGQSQRIVWDKIEMCQEVEQKFYDQYVRIGILIEEESVDIIDDPSTLITEHVQYKTNVRFYHKLFCEWYAAHYLADILQQGSNLDLSEFLRNLDPSDVQYIYRFSCGINSKSAEIVVNYLKNIRGGDKFAILCILEQTGKIDNIKETIQQLCFEGVLISGHDSFLLQRSSVQLLEIAAKNDITLRNVILHNCFQSVDRSKEAIRTTSGLTLTSRLPLKKIQVNFYNRKMTRDEAVGILEFSSVCLSLRKLWFRGSVPPHSFTVDSTLIKLRTRHFQVKSRMSSDDPVYILNLETGRWKRETDGEEPTKEEFEKMRMDFAKEVENKTEDGHKTDVKNVRGILSKKAERRLRGLPK